MKNLLLFTLLVNAFYSFSQTEKVDSKNYRNEITGDTSKNGLWLPAKKLNNDIEGSTYLFNSWEGFYQLNFNNNTYLKLVNLNYNIETKSIQSKISTDSVFQFEMKDVVLLKNGNDLYKVFNEELYKQVFEGKKISLYKSYKINIVNGVFNPLTQISTPSKYETKNDYFYLKGGVLNQVKLNKKNILLILIDQEELVKDYLKKNKLDFNNDIDLFKLFNYYDGL